MPKIIGESLADHRTLTRKKLFDALGQLLAEQPFDTITMSQIATRAKVGRTAVYNHFEDKEVLLLAYMSEATKEFANILANAVENEPNPIEQLRLYVHTHLEMTSRYHLAGRIHLREQVSRQNSGHLHEHANVIGMMLLRILGDAMRQRLIPTQDAHGLIRLIQACLAGQHLPSSQPERRTRITQIEAFILRAVGSPASTISKIPSPIRTGDNLESAEDRETSYMRCPVAN